MLNTGVSVGDSTVKMSSNFASFLRVPYFLTCPPAPMLVTATVQHPNFSLVRHDVTQPILLEVDQIYHLACPASPPHYQYNPVKTIKTSTMGTINMLGLAKRVKARILLASTSEIYGDPQVHPQPESYWGNVNTIGIRACYDEGKRVAETMMYAYKNQNNVDVRVARIFVSLQGRFFRKFRFMYDRLHLYRIHLAQGCTPTTGGLSRTSSYKRCKIKT